MGPRLSFFQGTPRVGPHRKVRSAGSSPSQAPGLTLAAILLVSLGLVIAWPQPRQSWEALNTRTPAPHEVWQPQPSHWSLASAFCPGTAVTPDDGALTERPSQEELSRPPRETRTSLPIFPVVDWFFVLFCSLR